MRIGRELKLTQTWETISVAANMIPKKLASWFDDDSIKFPFSKISFFYPVMNCMLKQWKKPIVTKTKFSEMLICFPQLSVDRMTDWWTETYESITFPPLRWWVVNMAESNFKLSKSDQIVWAVLIWKSFQYARCVSPNILFSFRLVLLSIKITSHI